MANDVLITIGADISKLVEGLGSAEGALVKFAEIYTAGKLIEKTAEFVTHMAELGEQTERFSAILGVSTPQIAELKLLAEESGGSLESMAMAMERFAFNLGRAQAGTGPAAGALRALGLSAKELLALPMDKQLEKIADEFSKYADGATKTQIAIALFGRAGAQMIPQLDGGRAAIIEARKEAEHLGLSLREEAQGNLVDLHHAIVNVSNAFTAFGEKLVAAVAPTLTAVINFISSLVGWLSKLLDKLFELDSLAKSNKKQMPGLPDEDAIKRQKILLEQEIDNVKGFYEIKKTLYDYDVATFQMTERQKADALKVALNQEMADLKSYYDRLKAETARTASERAEIDRAYNKEYLRAVEETLKIEQKARLDAVHQWQSMLESVQNAWDSQLKGLLTGTTTWAQAMKNIFLDLTIDIIKYLEKLIIERAAVALAAAAGSPIELAGHLKQIAGDMGQAYAGFAAYYAPFLGPAAPAAAAAEVAAVQTTAASMTLASFDVGAWDLPSDMLAMVHKGEMIVPEGPAGSMRDAIANGGGGGNITVHLSAFDASSVQNWLRTGGGTMLAREIGRAMQINPSYRPAFVR